MSANEFDFRQDLGVDTGAVATWYQYFCHSGLMNGRTTPSVLTCIQSICRDDKNREFRWYVHLAEPKYKRAESRLTQILGDERGSYPLAILWLRKLSLDM